MNLILSIAILCTGMFGIGVFVGKYMMMVRSKKASDECADIVKRAGQLMKKSQHEVSKYQRELERLQHVNDNLFMSLVDVARNEATVEIGEDGNVRCKRTRPREASLH